MFKIAVLISGNGSNLEALISACKKNVINGTIDIIISNNPDAYGIERAKNHSINYKIIDNKNMIAIGEIGLDYFRNISDPEIKKQVFREHTLNC